MSKRFDIAVVGCGSATSASSTMSKKTASRSFGSCPKKQPHGTKEGKNVSIQKVSSTDTSLRTMLQKARAEPLVLQAEEEGDFAVLPLDDEVLDLLLERNPTFIEECRQIRERMRQGDFVPYEEARKRFQSRP